MMIETIACNNCGEPITNESSSLEMAQRQPCPKCGSLARNVSGQMTGGLVLGGNFTANLISYPEKLIETARTLYHNGEFSMAVVVAHSACEISVDRAFSRGFL